MVNHELSGIGTTSCVNTEKIPAGGNSQLSMENQQPGSHLIVNRAGRTGLEPATSCVTGRRSNQTELPPL